MKGPFVLCMIILYFGLFITVKAQSKKFDTECKPVDLVFVVDSSGSINDDHRDNYDLVKTFLKSMSALLNIGPNNNQSHVAIVIYSASADVVLDLSSGTDTASVNNTIDKMVYMRSSTNIAGGVEMARTKVFKNDGDRKDVMDIMVVISDGIATIRQNETLRQATLAKDEKILIKTIGITDEVDSEELKAISSDSEVLIINSFQDLNMLMYREAIINATCFEPARKVIDPVGVCQLTNVVFVLDSSGSVNDNDQNTFHLAMQHSLDVISAIALGSTGVFASMVTFNDEANLNLKLDQRYGMDSIRAIMADVKFKGGRTNIAIGLKVATEHIVETAEERKEYTQDFIVLVSDGYSTMDSKEVLPAAEKAKEKGIYIITASVTDRVNTELLRRVSSNYTVYDATQPDSPQITVDKIVEVTCIPHAAPCEQLDIVFVLDSSGSINDDNETNFEMMKKFVKQVAGLQTLGPYHNQIAVVSFSDYARFEFFLRESRSIEIVEELVDNIRFIGGLTDVAKGLKVAREEVLGDSMNGVRKMARKIIVLVTDGHSMSTDDEVLEQVHQIALEKMYFLTAAVGRYANKEKLRYISFNYDVVNVPDVTKMQASLDHVVHSQCTYGGDCGQFDIIFILDNSDSMSSMNEDYWSIIKTFVMNVTSGFNIDTFFGSHVAVVTYSGSARIEFTLNESPNKEKAIEMISSMEAMDGGRTDLTAAIKLTMDQVMDPYMGHRKMYMVPTIVVMVTDGHVNKGSDDLDEIGKALMEKATVIALATSDYGSKETLKYISHHYMHVKDFDFSSEITGEVHDKICGSVKH